MNFNLKHKLTTYYSIAGAALVSANQASAQVIKTSVNYIGGLESYNIDIDNNGVNDFSVHCFAWGSFIGNSFNIGAAGNNEIIKDPDIAGVDKFVDVFGQGYLISYGKDFDFQTSVWAGGTSYVRGLYGGGYQKNPGGQVYNWGNVGGKNGFFVGVKFSIDSDIHYGWMRFNVSQKCDSWRLVEMAYESEPNIPITTPIPLSVNEHASDLMFAVSEFEVTVSSQKTLFTRAEVTSVSGELVKNIICNDKQVNFSRENLSGVYIITLFDAKGIVSRKKLFL